MVACNLDNFAKQMLHEIVKFGGAKKLFFPKKRDFERVGEVRDLNVFEIDR